MNSNFIMSAFLCEANANVNQKDQIGRTPMHIAAQYNSSPVLELLEKHGGSTIAKDNDGNTPLHYGKPYFENKEFSDIKSGNKI